MQYGNREERMKSKLWMRYVAMAILASLSISAEVRSQSFSTTTDTQQQPQRRSTAGAPGAGSGTLPSGAVTVALEDVSNMKLMPGSMVELHVLEEPDIDGPYRLDKDGNISLAWVGVIQLEGQTLREAEEAIRNRLLATQVLKVADVTVNLVEYSALNIVVMGEVAAPGTFPALGPRKLRDVLASAGGETPLAGNEIAIQRHGAPSDQPETVRYNRDANDPAPMNVIVNPGDSVTVKRAGVVYILGAVNRPGGYLMQEHGELNIDQALAMALGTALEAKVTDIRVFRKLDDGSSVFIQVNYKKINNGKVTPIQLQAQDVVYVPPSSLKEVALHGGTQVLNAAAAATIYTSAY
jgi:polysaccharide export outer membrane protein